MTNNYFSDKERVEIAQNEYSNYNVTDPITINNDLERIGYVSQVHDKPSGEQSFVITDHYVPPTAPIKERESVKDLFNNKVEI